MTTSALSQKLTGVAISPSLTTRVWRPCLGFIAIAGATGAIAVGFFSTLLLYFRMGERSPITLPLMAMIFGYFATASAKFAFRCLSSGALGELKVDTRPSIVLLRSFDADKVKIRRQAFSKAPIKYLTSPGTPTLEELVSRALEPFGPIVAIGRPGEAIPPLGFSRLWVPDDKWKEVVDECAHDCQLVVMIMSPIRDDDQGLAWELARLAQSDRPEQIVILAPPGVTSEMWKQFTTAFRHRFLQPDEADEMRSSKLERTIMMTFDPQWRPTWTVAKSKLFDESMYSDTLRSLVRLKWGPEFATESNLPRVSPIALSEEPHLDFFRPPPKHGKKAIVSLVLGSFSLGVVISPLLVALISPLGLGFGCLGLQSQYRVFAKMGIALSTVGLTLSIIVIFGYFLFAR